MSKADRGRSARQRLAEERARQAARERQQRLLVIVLGAVAAAAIIVVAVVLVRNAGGGSEPGSDYKGELAPATRQPDGSVAMAKAGVAKPMLELYEDFQCPACKNLEDRLGATIKEQAAAGKVKVVYRPFRLFRQEPLKSNSQRAANAAACAPAGSWIRFHDRLFAEQPDEGEAGFENADLVEWGREAGITGDAFAKCVDGGEKNAMVDQATAHAAKAGVSATPTLMLDGKQVAGGALTPDGLTKAIEAAGT
ncbi:DsbA family protein [Actinomadura rudentiformis]|uniref:Thioredoxin domain-containing protein n=1 Tax=Actinomadura rudentiformis TaxID=359158 RepID=A0A6H9YLH8_9ACTN|nr:thioredoxin domain-containing protein [Actinomadura rudentiformis]KAB2342739.1 thioredoxin domain-containing protein [Actinomadura rudentiformis]